MFFLLFDNKTLFFSSNITLRLHDLLYKFTHDLILFMGISFFFLFTMSLAALASGIMCSKHAYMVG